MRFVRDPLFVFIVVGVLLFAVDSLRQRGSTDRNIVVSKNDIQRLNGDRRWAPRLRPRNSKA